MGNALSVAGGIACNSSIFTRGLEVRSYSNESPILYIAPDNSLTAYCAHFYPKDSSYWNLGSTSYRWNNVYGNTFYAQYGSWNGSDTKLKKNITDLDTSLDDFLKIKTVKYNWKSSKAPQKKIHGVTTQNLKEIYPDLVLENPDFDMINYNELVALTIKAVQDLKKELDDLKKKA